MPDQKTKSGPRIAFAIGGLVMLALLIMAAWGFQDNLSRFMINPRTPFQTSPKPAAPDYARAPSWIFNASLGLTIDRTEKPDADIFYIHDAAFDQKENWNGAINDKRLSGLLNDIVLPNEVGPFVPVGKLYAPHYRAATLYARFTHKYDGLAAYTLAYTDIARAFDAYLADADPERPLILVGYGQGALRAAGLLTDYVQTNEKLRRRLVAAYLLRRNIPVTASLETDPDTPQTAGDAVSHIASVPLCAGPTKTGCVVVFNAIEAGKLSEIAAAQRRALGWSAGPTFPEDEPPALVSILNPTLGCINPLTWRHDEKRAEASLHKGAASATGLPVGKEPTLIRQAFGARCADGVLIVDRPAKPFLRQPRWFGRQWRNPSFNLFYADLRDDARRRLLLHAPVLAEQVRQLDPIDDALDVTDSPINTVPN